MYAPDRMVSGGLLNNFTNRTETGSGLGVRQSKKYRSSPAMAY